MESLFGRGKALERGVGGPEKFPVRLGVKVEELVAYNIIITFLCDGCEINKRTFCF